MSTATSARGGGAIPAIDGSVARAALVVNTRSRTGAKAFARAVDVLHDMDFPLASTYQLKDPARLVETVQAATEEGHDLIIVGGGDGTITSVVDVLAHTGVPMGLLPLGTANDFARTLHIPTDLDKACRTIVNSKVVDIDLGLAGHNYYANRAAVGLSANVAQAMSPTLKKRIGALAYPIATAKGFMRHRPFSARLTFPDGDHQPCEYESLLQVSVANGRYFGGGQLTANDSGIDDSMLDVSVVRHGKLGELAKVARGFKSGRLAETGQAETFRTRSVRVETEHKLPINIDGELVAHTPQEFSVARNSLHVLVPETWMDAVGPEQASGLGI